MTRNHKALMEKIKRYTEEACRTRETAIETLKREGYLDENGNLAEQYGREEGPYCYDCRRPYGSAGFPDLVVPHDVWKQISPTGDEGGLLCPSCLIARLSISRIECVGFLASGPLQSVSREEFNRLASERETVK